MATKEVIRQFFANSSKKQTKVSVKGKLSFNKLPKEVQDQVKQKLASKDNVMKKGAEGVLPGIKINGKQVTRDNIHEFEIKNKPKVIKTVEKEVKKPGLKVKKSSLKDKIKKVIKKKPAKK